uniref:BRO1 domain-containing protein n=1 Tax=Oryza punctata TaxID=4537 RepID=A0A0E0MAT5_ORYPU
MSAGNVMLAVHEKATSPTDLYRPLRLYIASAYSDREAAAADDDLAAVRDLRADVEQPSLPDPSSLERRRDALLAYARALALVEPRFPISLTFTWHDAFKTSTKVSVASIHLEKAAVLFNLGAVYSQIALAADRATDVGIWTACGSLQSAAGAFAWMRESGVAAKAVAAGANTVDVTPECAALLEKLMLAQAQVCFFEKVIADGKPPTLCSKVARQVRLFFALPLVQVISMILADDDGNVLKAAQFYADACYRCSLDLHDKEEIAQEITRLKIGISALADAKKVARGVAAPLLDSVNKLESNMKINLDRTMEENDRVYLMRVLDASSLGPLPAAYPVKPTSLAAVLDASKERLFSSLVPDDSMKALSKYTEMADNIIRTQAEKLQQASEITRVRLKEMDLPNSILSLEAKLQQLSVLSRVNQELLVQTEEMPQKEANIQDRLNLFASNLKTAGDNDTQIERGLMESCPLMSILDRRPIESALPSIYRPIMSLDGNEDAIVGALKQSLKQLESLGAQRAGLEDKLKEMKRKDDILPKLMTSVGSHDDLFKKEISKYDPVCAEIADNIVAQEQLLLQIHEAMRKAEADGNNDRPVKIKLVTRPVSVLTPRTLDKTSTKVSVASIHLEKAAVLFNLGAVYSQIALAADRATDVGIWTACGSLQSAAGAFAWMRESGVAAKAVAAGANTVDVTPECAALLEKLMLAQAQVCFFEKVIADGKPPTLCSKVARQVRLFFALPLVQVISMILADDDGNVLKAAQFYADACYRCSLDLHDKEEIAQEITRLKIGISALADAKKVARGVAAPLLDSVNKLESNMKINLDRTMEENDRVYLMRVLDASSLGPLPAAYPVKPTSLAAVLDASKERLFSSLVPDDSMKALSKYTEMADNIIRTQAEKLQQASEITRVRLKEMDLPNSILSLEAKLQQLSVLSRVNQELLVQTEEMPQKEANIQDRLNLFASNLKTAGDNDTQIERGLMESCPLMSILDRRPIESALPSIYRPIMSLDGNEDAIVGALKQSLKQLESLGAQRAGLEDKLKEMKRKDDILPKLMTSVGSHDDLFKKEISKYDPVCAEIADNIVAQEQLLLQIHEAMRKAEADGNNDRPVKIKLVTRPVSVLTPRTLDKGRW